MKNKRKIKEEDYNFAAETDIDPTRRDNLKLAVLISIEEQLERIADALEKGNKK